MKARKEVIGDCTLYQGDCIELLPRIERVDCVVTDPPYGDGPDADYGTYDKTIAGNDDPLLNCAMLRIVYHCLRKNATVYNFTNWRHQDFLRAYVARYSKLQMRHSIVWEKGMKMGGAFRPAHEIIMVLEKGKPAYRRKDYADVQRYSIPLHTAETHPHEKPLPLLKGMLAHSTNPGDTVLDPFMGSGSTGVACALMGRKFIGIELDATYFDMACRRIENAYRQGDLFGAAEPELKQEGMEV
jgi:DNA modification methylase